MSIDDLKALLDNIDDKTAKEINWIIGEAIYFAYECGKTDALRQTRCFYPEKERRVFEHLQSDREREMLSALMMQDRFYKNNKREVV